MHGLSIKTKEPNLKEARVMNNQSTQVETYVVNEHMKWYSGLLVIRGRQSRIIPPGKPLRR